MLVCVIHYTDSESDAQQELKLLFPDFSLSDWKEKEEPLLRTGLYHYDEQLGLHTPLQKNFS